MTRTSNEYSMAKQGPETDESIVKAIPDEEEVKLNPSSDEEAPAKTQAQILEDAPDGGLRAWLVVLSSFLVHVVTFGIQYSFGVYQSYYVNNTFKGRATPAEIALIGTVGFAAIFCIGIFSGKIAEAYGYRQTVLVGSVTMVVGLVLAAFSTELWQLLLTQGLIVGLGSSLVYYPAVSIPSQWWRKRRSLATGIAVAGSGLGALGIVPASDAMLIHLGLKWTLLATAAFSFVFLAIAVALLETRVPHRRRQLSEVMRTLVDFSQFKNPQFVPLLVGVFLNPFAYLLPFYFVPSYVQYLGLERSWGPLLLNIINAMSIVGRIAVGAVADRIGNVNALFLACIGEAVSCIGIWMWSATPGMLIFFAIFFGLAGGGFVSLMPSVSAQVCGVQNLAATIGLVYTALSVGHLAGPPLAALLVDNSVDPATAVVPAGGYAGLIIYGAVTAFLGSLAILYLRVVVIGGTAVPVVTLAAMATALLLTLTATAVDARFPPKSEWCIKAFCADPPADLLKAWTEQEHKVLGTAKVCGDGVCNVAEGESCANCPADCGGRCTMPTPINKCVKEGMVALTFDDGVSQYTEELVKTLNGLGIKATFFMLGTVVMANPKLHPAMKLVIESGHEIGLHSFNHRSYGPGGRVDPPTDKAKTMDPIMVRTETVFNDLAIQSVIGRRPTFLRLPYLEWTPDSLAMLETMGYTAAGINVDSDDWRTQAEGNVDKLVASFTAAFHAARAKDSSFISLQHDTLQFSTKAVPAIAAFLKQQNLKAVTMSECLGMPAYRADGDSPFLNRRLGKGGPLAGNSTAAEPGRAQANSTAAETAGPAGTGVSNAAAATPTLAPGNAASQMSDAPMAKSTTTAVSLLALALAVAALL
ncbi:hypothetical protein H9P43_000191 [Blastocladiella emersonii ATCC 22665]|nr:hypothetical protein H9P43_000191 [Blastocladiella emersonii ATCC 22665]